MDIDYVSNLLKEFKSAGLSLEDAIEKLRMLP